MKSSEWDSNPGHTDSKSNTLTTRSSCLPSHKLQLHHYIASKLHHYIAPVEATSVRFQFDLSPRYRTCFEHVRNLLQLDTTWQRYLENCNKHGTLNPNEIAASLQQKSHQKSHVKTGLNASWILSSRVCVLLTSKERFRLE